MIDPQVKDFYRETLKQVFDEDKVDAASDEDIGFLIRVAGVLFHQNAYPVRIKQGRG